MSAGITVKPSLGKVSGFHGRLKSDRHERAKSDMGISIATRIVSTICCVTVSVLMVDVVLGKIEGNGGSSVITCHTEHGDG